MNSAQKKKLAALVLERLRTADLLELLQLILPRTDTIPIDHLGPTLDLLARNGFETVVRHRSRQGERHYNKLRPRHQRFGLARFKYDPAPRDNQGSIHLNLLTCCSYYDANGGDKWAQVWIRMDKDTAMKILVLGTFPSGTIAVNSPQ